MKCDPIMYAYTCPSCGKQVTEEDLRILEVCQQRWMEQTCNMVNGWNPMVRVLRKPKIEVNFGDYAMATDEMTCTEHRVEGKVWRSWTVGYNNTHSLHDAATATNTTCTNTVTWNNWCSDTSTNTATTTAQSYHDVWYTWNDSTQTPVEEREHNDIQRQIHIENNQIYRTWTVGSVSVTNEGHNARTATEEELEAIRLRDEQRAEAYREEQEERELRAKKVEQDRKDAETKAKELLMDLIGDEEIKVYEETGRLFVKGRKHDYIVNKGGFVQQITKDKMIDLCVHLEDRYAMPETDNVIALKLALEAQEDKVLEMANVHNRNDRPSELPKSACMGV
jgi:hypothetical protein